MNRPPRKHKRDPVAEGYRRLITTTALTLRAWLRAHPEAKPVIQFNWVETPQFGGVIAALDQAVTAHYVTPNDDARKMIADIDYATGFELTVLQFRAAWEGIDQLAPS